MKLGSAEFIFYAGAHWRVFDYRAGYEQLLQAGSAEFIYKAGTLWKEFDYVRAWKTLESDVKNGAPWRGKAFRQPLWRRALKQIWVDAVNAT